MDVLVSDTSVVIDLERAGLIECIFALPYRFVVPDALYEKEIKDYGGERLLALGLHVRSLTGAQLTEAQRLRTLERRISIHDSYALSLAKAEAAILLAGDKAMRKLAEAEEVRCHGVLWVFDQLEERRVVTAAVLHDGLTRVIAHPRCWLPRDAVNLRLTRYAAAGDEGSRGKA
jgi:predicted nucleic acid-binding protein